MAVHTNIIERIVERANAIQILGLRRFDVLSILDVAHAFRQFLERLLQR